MRVMTTQSHIIIKLNPMNNPRTPPQSATRERNEYASASFRTSIVGLANIKANTVPSLGITVGSSVTYNKKNIKNINIILTI